MFNYLIGEALSFLYLMGILIIPRYLPIKTLEGKRKFVHIMWGNWWFILLLFFDSFIWAIIPPCSFIIINFVSVKRGKENGLLSSLERDKPSFGIVTYPLAMSLLVVVSFLIVRDVKVGGIGLLALAYGDGIAALSGNHFKYKVFKIFENQKSLSGCVGMFTATFIATIMYIVLVYSLPFQEAAKCSAMISILCTAVEVFTPFGVDNITVPLMAIIVFCIMIN